MFKKGRHSTCPFLGKVNHFFIYKSFYYSEIPHYLAKKLTFAGKIFFHCPIKMDFLHMVIKKAYECFGTCSKMIMVSVEDGIIKEVQFFGGCHGNTQGVAILVKGMKVEDAIAKLSGIDCGGRGTSCPDQLARALRLFL